MAGERGRLKKSKLKKSISKVYASKKEVITRFFKQNPFVEKLIVALVIFSIFSYLGLIRIGPIKISEQRYITVIGSYTSVEDNKVASFYATVSEKNIIKDTAVSDVERRAKDLITAVENFGIDPRDIKTTNNAVYQEEDFKGITSTRPANADATPELNWVASTTVEIRLKDISKVSELTNLINNLGSTEIYGPTFSVDNEAIDEGRLLTNAIDDAKDKARFIARNHSKRLGDILNIEEVGDYTVMPMGEVLGMGAGSGSFSPGTTEIVKKVRVRFVLR